MALKDLIRRGRPPKPKRAPAVEPIQIDAATWFYPERKGMTVVHEVRERDRHIRTDTFTVKWKDVRMGLELHQNRRKAKRGGKIREIGI